MLDRFNVWVGTLVSRLDELKEREDGQAMVEYGLILALVSVAALVILKTLGTNVTGVFTKISDAIAAA
jgi:pilus assembly protein Flp/PilA